ncbi:MAG: hypothetical protein KKD17_03025 [Nanoarchaeota archaeon]|nr:hypothetical protein [Nanoarchaeota archaeon]
MSEEKIIDVQKASRETLDRLQNSCIAAMEDYLDTVTLLDRQRDEGLPSLYERMTGMPLPPEEDDEDQYTGPEKRPYEPHPINLGQDLLPGTHTARVDIPCMSDHGNEKDEELTDILRQFVTDDIIMPCLRDSKSRQFSSYFDLAVPKELLENLREGQQDIKERYTLNEKGRREIGPTIDRCVEEVLSLFNAREPDFEEGARIKVTCSVDQDGNLRLTNTQRQYIERVYHEFPVILPDLSEATDLNQFLRVMLPEYIEMNAVRGNLLATGHPEYYKLFKRDKDWTMEMTAEGKAKFRRFRRDLTDQLVKEIMKLPRFTKEGMIMVRGFIEEQGIWNPKLTYRETTGARSVLPDTEGKTYTERDDIYERAAINVAYNLLEGNIPHIEAIPHERVRVFNALEYLRKKMITEDPEEPGILAKAAENGELDMPQEKASRLERMFYKVLDGVREQLNLLKEEKEFPFYIGMVVWDREDNQGHVAAHSENDDGLPRITFDLARKVFLDPRRPADANQLILNIAAAEDGKLTPEAMRNVAREIVEKTISYVALAHVRGQEHPLLKSCFFENPEKKGQYLLSEKGASYLERVIDEMSRHAALTTMQMRVFAPEQLSGFRFRMGYKVTESDAIYILPQSLSLEYFVDMKNARTSFPVPGLRPRTADINKEFNDLVSMMKEKGLTRQQMISETVARTQSHVGYTELKLLGKEIYSIVENALSEEPEKAEITPQMLRDTWRENQYNALMQLGRDVIIRMIETNMKGTEHIKDPRVPLIPKHPAYDSYFTIEQSGNYTLTRTGENVLGKLVQDSAVRLATDLMKQGQSENGYGCQMIYAMTRKGAISYELKQVPIEMLTAYARMMQANQEQPR